MIVECVGRELQGGRMPSGRQQWHVLDVPDEATAYSLVVAASPAVWNGLIKQNVSVRELGDDNWEGEVSYGVIEDAEVGQIGWSFEIGTESLHITHAVAHVQSYAASGTAPDHKGAINVRKDGSGQTVEGCDILIPVFHWEETHPLPAALVASHGWIIAMEAIVGHINSATWRIWGKGELVLLGITGAKKGQEPVPVTYRFGSSRTKTGLTIGDITGITKEGHNYLWVEYEPVEDGSAVALAHRPKAVHVERVYDYADFNGLSLPDPWS